MLVPEKNRNAESENIISKHLHAFFRKNAHACREQVKELRKKGLLFVVISIFLLTGASYISSLKSGNILLHVLLVVLEPADWFLIWKGLDDLLSSSHEETPELDFYNKVVKSKIVFVGIPKGSVQKEESVLLRS